MGNVQDRQRYEIIGDNVDTDVRQARTSGTYRESICPDIQPPLPLDNESDGRQ